MINPRLTAKTADMLLGPVDPTWKLIPDLDALDQLLADGKPKPVGAIIGEYVSEAQIKNMAAFRIIQSNGKGGYNVWAHNTSFDNYDLHQYKGKKEFTTSWNSDIWAYLSYGPRSVLYYRSKDSVPTLAELNEKRRPVRLTELESVGGGDVGEEESKESEESPKPAKPRKRRNPEVPPVTHYVEPGRESIYCTGRHGLYLWKSTDAKHVTCLACLRRMYKAGITKRNPSQLKVLRARKFHSQYGYVYMARVYDNPEGNYLVWSDDTGVFVDTSSEYTKKYGHPVRYDLKTYRNYNEALGDFLVRKTQRHPVSKEVILGRSQ